MGNRHVFLLPKVRARPSVLRVGFTLETRHFVRRASCTICCGQPHHMLRSIARTQLLARRFFWRPPPPGEPTVVHRHVLPLSSSWGRRLTGSSSGIFGSDCPKWRGSTFTARPRTPRGTTETLFWPSTAGTFTLMTSPFSWTRQACFPLLPFFFRLLFSRFFCFIRCCGMPKSA